MPTLRYSTPDGPMIHSLREIFTLGRDAKNDLVLSHDKKVSRQHACVRLVGTTYVVEDLHSANGTFLERGVTVTRITSPQQLLPNDVIRVGSIRLVFDMDAAAEIPPGVTAGSERDAPPHGLRDAPPHGLRDAPSQVRAEAAFDTDEFGVTKEGRYIPIPVHIWPQELLAASSQAPSPSLQQAQERILELEQHVAELRAQLAKQQGEG